MGRRTDLGDLVLGKTMQGLKYHIKELLTTWGSPWSSLEQKSHMLQLSVFNDLSGNWG